METETGQAAEVSAGLSWTWLAAYFAAALLIDWVKSCFQYRSRPVATKVLVAYYVLTYLLSLCKGLLSEDLYHAELYFIYFLLVVDVVKGLKIMHYFGFLVFWQLFLTSLLVIVYGFGVKLPNEWMEILVSKAEIALIEGAPEAEAVRVTETAGFSWIWLSIYAAIALLTDWVRLCIRCADNFHGIRALLAYYSLNYLLYLSSGYITGWWYTLDYYFIWVVALYELVVGLDLPTYFGALIWWHIFLGAVRVILHVCGVSASSGWTELLITGVVVPLAIVLLKYGLCTAACFFISLGIINLLDYFRFASSEKPKSEQEMSIFAVNFFSLFFLEVGLMLLAWALMWVVALVFGSVPWLMGFWYKGAWALLSAVMGSMVMENGYIEREVMVMNNFTATLISLYVLGGLASLVLG
jgi:hypothetical protein